jgi:hypothetical protein
LYHFSKAALKRQESLLKVCGGRGIERILPKALALIGRKVEKYNDILTNK